MVLLTAFQTLLYRYTGQTDIVTGTPIAGRRHPAIENLIGFFLNMLAIRVDLSGNPTFLELLARARQSCLDAYAHEDLPFEMLVEKLNPERAINQNPAFQVTFVLQNFPKAPLEFSDVTAVEMDIDPGIARFDLHVFMTEEDNGLKGYFEFNTDLFNATTIERMIGHYQTLLEGIVTNPNQTLSEIPLLTEAEKHQLIVEPNDTKTDYPKDKCIHQLLEEQVEKTPHAIAVVFEDQQLTYRELNHRANQLAHYLRKLGVGPEVLVGLCVERSLEMIVGILAILKAGGAYVPLDPSYPKERLAFMLEDSQAGVLISQSSLIEGLPAHNATVLCLDRDWEEISTQSQDNPLPLTTPDNLAYVIYTSGSTGTPKGALIAHHNVVRLFRATDSWFHFGPEDVWTLFHSYAFDFSVWELWGALIHGGRLVIVPFEVSRSPREFYELLCREHVTVLNQTPSAFRQLVQAEESIIDTTRLGLRLVIFGGEELEFQSLKPWFDRHGDHSPRLINMYGITETTVHVTYRPIKEADLTAGLSSLIGAPIPDLELYVLDGHGNLVPVGVPGELYVGGAGLARGYLNRAELTAERFVGHRFDDGKGRRLYRSGDLVRRRVDGDIEYLGRVDNQVKIRGHRIELGEVEAILAQHPAIQQAVVLAREDSPKDRRLVAYIVAAARSAPAVDALRGFLQQKLPEYMVPSAFMFLDSLPLTPNGKLDRKALLAPDQTRPELNETFVAPTTPVEEILANIWAEVLKVERVGIHDNFFHLGGHSLLATQVVSRINTAFPIHLPLRSLFESPTIAGLADSVQAGMGNEIDSRPLQPILPVPRNNPLPLSFAQERLWFLDRLDPDNATYNVPAAFRLAGDLNLNALEQSLNEVVRRHECLRTVFVTVDDNPVQKILPSLVIALTPIDLSDHPENDRESALNSLIKQEAERPFDLSHGPLIRACLWRLAPHDHLLALNLHHIISDGWSMSVLFGELSALYQGYCAARPASLPELPVQYADYALWQRDWLQGENLDIQLAYWSKQLDSLSTLQLPTNHPRPAVQTYRGASRSLELSTQLSQAIKTLGRREGVTLFMTLLAAFQTLLCRYSGQQDIAVGSPIAGRTRREIEGLIGFFVNTLVLRSDLSNNPTFKKLLRQVRETTLEAYTHQDLPFEKLVEELHPERNPSISPLFQVMFILQNNADQPLEFERLAVSPIRTGSQVAKFDLTLTMSERQGTLRASFNYNTDLFEA
ncbi:MAG TPA: amino acid adenylation domain-containing protein, partial [Candidatus Binatia bacterium]|nr:amino acid adenylation domain-containing protein [Candidatus Binatia bacterium]